MTAVLEAPAETAGQFDENRRKWIADLRSGKFKQTKNTLRDANGFCCLGVACETAIANGVALAREVNSSGDSFLYYAPDDREGSATTGSLPYPVARWLGVGGDNIHWGEPDVGTPDNAVSANDAFGWSFDRIADKLEEYWGLA